MVLGVLRRSGEGEGGMVVCSFVFVDGGWGAEGWSFVVGSLQKKSIFSFEVSFNLGRGKADLALSSLYQISVSVAMIE